MSNNEVQDLIAELRRLQIRQTDIIGLLARLTDVPRDETRTVSPHRPTPPNAIRAFAIGDRVRIVNPRPFQATTGTITKIGTNRNTVRTASGGTIVRAPKNLILL